MATKLGSMVTYLDWLLPIKPNDNIINWFCKRFWATATSMATKIGKMRTFLERFPLITLHDHVITWFCEIK